MQASPRPHPLKGGSELVNFISADFILKMQFMILLSHKFLNLLKTI